MKYESGHFAVLNVGDNPNPQSIIYNANLAPHAETLRGSYTVPERRAAVMYDLSVVLTRTSAATANPNSQVRIEIVQRGLAARNLFIHNSAWNSTFHQVIKNMMCYAVLHPGDIINVYTADTSTGGTVDYGINISIGEWDV